MHSPNLDNIEKVREIILAAVEYLKEQSGMTDSSDDDSYIVVSRETQESIFKYLNLSIIAGEHLNSKYIEELTKISELTKKFPVPNDDDANRLFSDFFEYGRVIAAIEKNLKTNIKFIGETLHYSRPKIIGQYSRVEDNQLKDVKNNDLINHFSLVKLNIRISIVDLFLKKSHLTQLLTSNASLKRLESQGEFKTQEYFKIIQNKCKFLIRKLIFRGKIDEDVEEAILIDGEIIDLKPENFETDIETFKYVLLRCEKHYDDKELNSHTSGEIEAVRIKLGNMDESMSIEEFHIATKHYKDKENSIGALKKLKSLFSTIKQKQDKSFYYNNYALDIVESYINNNLLSLLIEKDEDVIEIKKVFNEALSHQETSGLKNYFPFEKYCKYLLNKIVIEWENYSLNFSEDSMSNIDFYLGEYKSYVKKWEDNLSWCPDHNFIHFRETYCHRIHDNDTEKIKVFIASSFVLPINYSKVRNELYECNEEYKNYVNILQYHSINSIQIDRINELKEEVESTKNRYIEIVSLFSAIVIFASGSIQIFSSITNIGNAMLMLSVFGVGLLLFASVIFLMHDKKKLYAGFVISCIAMLSFFVIGAIYISNEKDKTEIIGNGGDTKDSLNIALPTDAPIIDTNKVKDSI